MYQFIHICFYHRDMDPEIRATAIDGLGHWLLLQPAVYLSQTYLKYIAWGVSDGDAAVRMVAVNALIALYSVEGNVSQLKELTTRFAPRFTELVDDIDDDVAVAGVQLVTLLVQQGALPSTAAAHVYRLLGCDSAALREAAADLAAGMLKDRGTQALQELAKQQAGKQSSGKKGKKGAASASNAAAAVEGRSAAELKLAGLLQMLRLLTVEANKESGGDLDDEEAMEEPLSQTHLAMVVDVLYDK